MGVWVNNDRHSVRFIAEPSHQANGPNPRCGGQLTLYAKVAEDGTLEDVAFQGSGCAISKASASLMTDFVKGKSVPEIEADFTRFHDLVTSSPSEEANLEGLGKLAVFAGVREYPMRVKCATLAWHALHEALVGDGATAKTE